MQVLLICDDYWHPGNVPIEGLAPLKKHGFDFDIITDAGKFDPKSLDDYPVCILSKCDEVSASDKSSWKTKAVQEQFAQYVRRGGGLLAIHTALVAGENTARLDKLIGSKFTFHPKDAPVHVQAVKKHPIVNNVGMFCEIDEHYRLEILADDIDVFMASYSNEQGESSKFEEDPYHNTTAWLGAAGYTRCEGKGRICVLTPGHLLSVWHNAEYQKVLINSINWCGKAI